MLSGWSPAEKLFRERQTNCFYYGHANYDWFSARSRYMLDNVFSREALDQTFQLWIKHLEHIFYLTSSGNHVFVIMKTNVFGIDGGMLV